MIGQSQISAHKNGFSYQTGVGGASIASAAYLAEEMKKQNVHMRFCVGGLTKPLCELLDNGQVDILLDTQDFDRDAVESAASQDQCWGICRSL